MNPDLSDSEFIDRIEPMDPATPGFGGSEAGDMPTPGGDLGGGEDDGDDGEDDESEELRIVENSLMQEDEDEPDLSLVSFHSHLVICCTCRS